MARPIFHRRRQRKCPNRWHRDGPAVRGRGKRTRTIFHLRPRICRQERSSRTDLPDRGQRAFHRLDQPVRQIGELFGRPSFQMLDGLHRRVFRPMDPPADRSSGGRNQPRSQAGEAQKYEKKFHPSIMARAALPLSRHAQIHRTPVPARGRRKPIHARWSETAISARRSGAAISARRSGAAISARRSGAAIPARRSVVERDLRAR